MFSTEGAIILYDLERPGSNIFFVLWSWACFVRYVEEPFLCWLVGTHKVFVAVTRLLKRCRRCCQGKSEFILKVRIQLGQQCCSEQGALSSYSNYVQHCGGKLKGSERHHIFRFFFYQPPNSKQLLGASRYHTIHHASRTPPHLYGTLCPNFESP